MQNLLFIINKKFNYILDFEVLTLFVTLVKILFFFPQIHFEVFFAILEIFIENCFFQ